MGAKWARKIQWGTEVASAIGTKVAATSIARAVGVFEDDDVHNRHVEDVNLINGTTDSYVARKGGKCNIDFDPASFEQFTDVLQCGITEATASVDGAGTGKIWVYPFPTSSTAAHSGKSIEFGDNAGAEVMEYSFVQNWTLAGGAGSQCTLNSAWYGRQQTPQAFTSLSATVIPTVSPILFGNAKLYIDDVGGTIGTTQITCTVLNFSLAVNTGLVPFFGANGALYFCKTKVNGFEPVLTLSMEHNATSIAEKAKFRANTPRQLKLIIEGAALTTAGTTYTYKTIVFESQGIFRRVPPMGENDGNNIIDFEFVGAYNRTNGLFGQMIVVNELATIP